MRQKAAALTSIIYPVTLKANGKIRVYGPGQQGRAISGALDAGDENEAITSLQGKGYFILSISSDKTGKAGGAPSKFSGGAVAARDLVFFAEQLATLLNGGVPLVRALSLWANTPVPRACNMPLAKSPRTSPRERPFIRRWKSTPKVFDTLWVSLVQAGEMGGQLPKSLKQIGMYLSAQTELNGKVITALAYPGILFTISMGVLAFFIIKIVPVFADIFASFQVPLPPLTRVIIIFSNVLVHHPPGSIFTLTALYFLWSAYVTTDAGKHTRWKIIFGFPFFGPFVMNIMVERLLTTMSALVESGVSILNAISVLEGVFAENIIFKKLLGLVKGDVAGGKSISGAFKKTGLLPPLVTEMMFMGEESGKLPDMLVTLSNFYREQIDQFTRRFTSIIEPIMVVGIGAIVGTIVLAVFMPIFKLSTMGAK